MSSPANEVVWDMRPGAGAAPAVEMAEFWCNCGACLTVYSRLATPAVVCPCCGGIAGGELLTMDNAGDLGLYDDEGPDVQVYVTSLPPPGY